MQNSVASLTRSTGSLEHIVNNEMDQWDGLGYREGSGLAENGPIRMLRRARPASADSSAEPVANGLVRQQRKSATRCRDCMWVCAISICGDTNFILRTRVGKESTKVLIRSRSRKKNSSYRPQLLNQEWRFQLVSYCYLVWKRKRISAIPYCAYSTY